MRFQSEFSFFKLLRGVDKPLISVNNESRLPLFTDKLNLVRSSYVIEKQCICNAAKKSILLA